MIGKSHLASSLLWLPIPVPGLGFRSQQPSKPPKESPAKQPSTMAGLAPPWAGWPCDLLHWRCWQYIAAITRLRPQRVDVDSVGMCVSCSLGFWHEDSLKFSIVYQCVSYVWMLALVLVQICLDWSLAGVGWDTFFDIIEGLPTDCATCWRENGGKSYKISWEMDSFKSQENQKPPVPFFFAVLNYESKIGEDRSVMELDSTII